MYLEKKNNTKNTAMATKADSINKYIQELPAERKEAFEKIRDTILKNLPEGFEECPFQSRAG